MKQKELSLDILSDYREKPKLQPYFKVNPSYINDPLEYVLKRLQESNGIEREEVVGSSRLYNGLSVATLDLYCESLFTGFETGVDLALLLMGYRPIYQVLPDSQKNRERAEGIINSLNELTVSAGADKVADLIKSLGYGSIAELIVETEK